MPLKPKIAFPIKVSWLKDAIYFIGIAISIIFYFRGKAIENAKKDAQIDKIISQQQEIIQELQENRQKWLIQSKENGAFEMFVTISSKH